MTLPLLLEMFRELDRERIVWYFCLVASVQGSGVSEHQPCD